jgi:predicted CoA-binding protein
VGNAIYKKLRDGGYRVYAVNPNATQVEGDRCYPNLPPCRSRSMEW